jgi:hypothetical protein
VRVAAKIDWRLLLAICWVIGCASPCYDRVGLEARRTLDEVAAKSTVIVRARLKEARTVSERQGRLPPEQRDDKDLFVRRLEIAAEPELWIKGEPTAPLVFYWEQGTLRAPGQELVEKNGELHQPTMTSTLEGIPLTPGDRYVFFLKQDAGGALEATANLQESWLWACGGIDRREGAALEQRVLSAVLPRSGWGPEERQCGSASSGLQELVGPYEFARHVLEVRASGKVSYGPSLPFYLTASERERRLETLRLNLLDPEGRWIESYLQTSWFGRRPNAACEYLASVSLSTNEPLRNAACEVARIRYGCELPPECETDADGRNAVGQSAR